MVEQGFHTPHVGRSSRPPATIYPQLQRFWDKVDKTPGHGPQGECWAWIAGTRGKTGYGCLKFKGKVIDAHRFCYQMMNGVLLETEECVCHTCDYRLCVNPKHLFLDSKAGNNRDMAAKGRVGVKFLENQKSCRSYPPNYGWCCYCKDYVHADQMVGGLTGYTGECITHRRARDRDRKRRQRSKVLIIDNL